MATTAKASPAVNGSTSAAGSSSANGTATANAAIGANAPAPTTASTPASAPVADQTSTNGSFELVSQMVDSGLTQAFSSLQENVTATIREHGEQYLAGAGGRIKKSAQQLGAWSRENPVKAAVVVAGVCGLAAYLVARAARTTGNSCDAAGAGATEAGDAAASRFNDRAPATAQ